jgi:hypothetical protein
MSRRHARFRFSLCAAALMVTLGWAATGAIAAANASAAPPKPPIHWNSGRGLILTLPAAPSGDAPSRAHAARPRAPDNPDADKPPLCAHLNVNPGSRAFTPMAGIVYAF